MDTFIGCETGFVKGVNSLSAAIKNLFKPDPPHRKNNSIACIQWMCKNNQISYGTKGGLMYTLNLDNEQVRKTGTNRTDTEMVSFHTSSKKNVILFNNSLEVWKKNILLNSIKLKKKCKTLKYINKTEFAVAGIDYPMQIWDINTSQCVYSTKNLPDDWLNLKVDSKIYSIDSINADIFVSNNGNIYSYTKLNLKPNLCINIMDSKNLITKIKISQDRSKIIYGDVVGNVGVIDIRKPNLLLHKFEGGVTSITDIKLCEDIIVVSSLDRYVRFYEIGQKKFMQKIYTKSKPLSIYCTDTCLLRS
ncbi:hypothetical protein A3Q56_04506 [Intoshia linei]|uniref:Uncharacterized protein n=1 Tax=Intoshia linei TaxID=1819745 RepID=A0A177B0J8_9BILA|nr:hypothetical protein A3Q56_04506 [Intoshia linei]